MVMEVTMTLGTQLRKLRKQHGYTQDQLADHLGYKSFTTIQKWESDDALPPVPMLKRLATLYTCSINDFFIEKPIKRSIPILGTVVGGTPIEAIEDFLGAYDVQLEEDGHEYVYLRVVGDSMIGARIYPGDDLFVRRQSMVDNNDIAIVLIDQEATVKRVFIKENKLILVSENEKYAPMEFDLSEKDSKQFYILGKVLHNRISIS
jgi:repressor LexA